MDQHCIRLGAAAPSDWPAVRALLETAALPLDGVSPTLEHFVVARREGEIIGVAGLERYGTVALLRSVAVASQWRGTGVGRLVVDEALFLARHLGVNDVYLLTESARDYFPKLGFGCVRRDELPAALGASRELCGACPDSAVAMKRTLGDTPHVPPHDV